MRPLNQAGIEKFTFLLPLLSFVESEPACQMPDLFLKKSNTGIVVT